MRKPFVAALLVAAVFTPPAPAAGEAATTSRACGGFEYSGVIKQLRVYAASCRTARRVARGWTDRVRCFAQTYGGSRTCNVGSWRCRARSPGSYTQDQRVRCRSNSRLVTFTHGY